MKAILGNIPTYYLSLFKAPCGVIETPKKINKRLLWGSLTDKAKINWVSWEKVITSKDKGGLGVRSLHPINISLMTWWRLHTDRNSLWCCVISGINHSIIYLKMYDLGME